jgi:hypothetical protein
LAGFHGTVLVEIMQACATWGMYPIRDCEYLWIPSLAGLMGSVRGWLCRSEGWEFGVTWLWWDWGLGPEDQRSHSLRSSRFVGLWQGGLVCSSGYSTSQGFTCWCFSCPRCFTSAKLSPASQQSPGITELMRSAAMSQSPSWISLQDYLNFKRSESQEMALILNFQALASEWRAMNFLDLIWIRVIFSAPSQLCFDFS